MSVPSSSTTAIVSKPEFIRPASEPPSNSESFIEALLRDKYGFDSDSFTKAEEPIIVDTPSTSKEQSSSRSPSTPPSGDAFIQELLRDKYGFDDDPLINQKAPATDDERIDELLKRFDESIAAPEPEEKIPSGILDTKEEKPSLALATPAAPEPPYKPMAFETLFPADLKTMHFKQQDIGDCYLLAVLDALFHHPDGEAWLRKIKFEAAENADKKITAYKVTFPSGLMAEFDANEVGKPKNGKRPVDGSLGIQLLELAFAKSTLILRNAVRVSPFANGGKGNTVQVVECGTPYEALHFMLGGAQINLTAIPATPLPDGITVGETDPLAKNPNSLKMLKDLLRQIDSDKSHTSMISAATPPALTDPSVPDRNKITVTRDDGRLQTLLRYHIYSIRNFDLANETITLADPYDTKAKVMTLSFKEFVQGFQGIGGVKLPKPATA